MAGIDRLRKKYLAGEYKRTPEEQAFFDAITRTKSNDINPIGYVARKGYQGAGSALSGLEDFIRITTADEIDESKPKNPSPWYEYGVNRDSVEDLMSYKWKEDEKPLVNLQNLAGTIGNAAMDYRLEKTGIAPMINSFSDIASKVYAKKTGKAEEEYYDKAIEFLLGDNYVRDIMKLDKVDETIAANEEDMNKGTKAVGDLASIVGYLAPAVLTRGAGSLTMAGAQAGNTMRDAIEHEADLDTALGAGIVSGATTYGLERLAAGNKILDAGGSLLGQVGKTKAGQEVAKRIPDVIKNIKNTKVGGRVFNAAGEMLEEVPQELNRPNVEGIYKDEDEIDPATLKSVFENAGLAGILSLFIGGPNANTNTQPKTKEAPSPKAEGHTGESAPPINEPSATEADATNTTSEPSVEKENQTEKKVLSDEELNEIENKTLGKNMTTMPKANSGIGKVFDRIRRELVSDRLTNEQIAEMTGNDLLNADYHFARSAGKAADFAIGGKGPTGKPEGMRFDNEGNVVGGSLNSIFESIDNKGIEAVKSGKVKSREEYRQKLYNYLRNMNNVVRFAKNEPVFGFDSGVDSNASQQLADRYKQQFPEFETFAKDIYEYNNSLLQRGVDSRLFTAEAMKSFMESNPYYVPTFRDESQIETKQRKGENLAPGIKKATGGRAPMVDLGGALARQTQSFYRRAAVNRYGLRLLDVLEHASGKTKDFIDSHVRVIGIQPQEKPFANNSETGEIDITDILQFKKDPSGKGSTFTVYRDGTVFTLELSEEMARAVEALSGDKNQSLILKAIGKVTGAFRDLVTKYNPTFPILNTVKDAQSAFMYSKNPMAFAKNLPGTVEEIVSNGEQWKLYQSMGGFSSSLFDVESGVFDMAPLLKDMKPGEMVEYLTKQIKNPTLGNVERLNILFEQIMRFNEFRTTIEKAGNTNFDTLSQALFDSAEVTLNFDRHGSLGKAINQVVPFFNAGVQGVSRGARFAADAIRNKDIAKMIRVAVYATLTGITPQVVMELAYGNSDEEEVKQAWEEISPYYKNNFFLIWTGEGFLRIPKGRMQGVLSAVTSVAMDLAKGEEVDVKEELVPALQNLLPPNPFSGTVFSPLTRAKLFDPDDPGQTWYGGDIESYADQQKLPYERYDSSTSDVFIKMAELIAGETGKGISPKKLQTIFTDYFGAVGDIAVDLTDSEQEKGFVSSKFVVDPTFQNTLTSDFYDVKNKYSDIAKDPRAAKEDVAYAVIMESYFDMVNKDISLWRGMQEKYQSNDRLSKKDKEEKIEALQELINEEIRQALAKEKEFSAQGTSYYEELLNDVTSSKEYKSQNKIRAEEMEDLVLDYAKHEILNDLGEDPNDSTDIRYINNLIDSGFSDADALILVSDLGSYEEKDMKRKYLYDSDFTDKQAELIAKACNLETDGCAKHWKEAESLGLGYKDYLMAYSVISSNTTGYKKDEKINDVVALYGIDKATALKLWDYIKQR